MHLESTPYPLLCRTRLLGHPSNQTPWALPLLLRRFLLSDPLERLSLPPCHLERHPIAREEPALPVVQGLAPVLATQPRLTPTMHHSVRSPLSDVTSRSVSLRLPSHSSADRLRRVCKYRCPTPLHSRFHQRYRRFRSHPDKAVPKQVPRPLKNRLGLLLPRRARRRRSRQCLVWGCLHCSRVQVREGVCTAIRVTLERVKGREIVRRRRKGRRQRRNKI